MGTKFIVNLYAMNKQLSSCNTYTTLHHHTMSGHKKTVFVPRVIQENKDVLGQPVCPPSFQEFINIFNVVDENDLEKNPELISQVQGVLYSSVRWPHYKEVIPKMDNIKLVAFVGTGKDMFIQRMKQECPTVVARNDVVFAHTPGATAESTANIAMTLILSSARDIIQGVDIAMGPKSIERFLKVNPYVDVAGRVLGILGMGNIGFTLAKRAKAFNMKIYYHNRNRRNPLDEDSIDCVYYEKLHEMLPECDYVVVSCPLTPDTHHLISHKEFSIMKNTATIVNVARGKIVDTDALVDALAKGVIHGAALDVTDPEPLPRDHPLLTLPNVIITPHIGGFAAQSWVKHWNMTLENFRAVLIENQTPPYPVSFD